MPVYNQTGLIRWDKQAWSYFALDWSLPRLCPGDGVSNDLEWWAEAVVNYKDYITWTCSQSVNRGAFKYSTMRVCI